MFEMQNRGWREVRAEQRVLAIEVLTREPVEREPEKRRAYPYVNWVVHQLSVGYMHWIREPRAAAFLGVILTKYPEADVTWEEPVYEGHPHYMFIGETCVARWTEDSLKERVVREAEAAHPGVDFRSA